ncbi:MAG: ThuA domain-containing protein [Verrucomicrobiae bacterium]|nr:ThuA domain-containing protein [Verrucomicrobiae bacterium]
MKATPGMILRAIMLVGITFAQAQKPAQQKPAPDKTKVPELPPAELHKINAAVPARASAKPQKTRRILVFWRCEGFFHGSGIAGGNKAIELMGQKTGAYTADFSRDYEVFEPANLQKYDAVVLNNTTQLKLSSTQQEALLAFVRGGKGIVGIHAATDNFYDWPEGAKMLGGLFAGHPWGAGGTWAFKLDEPDHPLTRAFAGKGFRLKDEIYQFKDPYTRADRRVLVSLDLSDEATAKVKPKSPRPDNDYAVAWIKKEGNGRVFYCSLGHAANVFQEAAIVRFYLDGIQYALGDLPADDSPK